MATYDHCIIGAGIIGVSIAFRLTQAGRSVLLVDRKGIAEETSRGNAGALAFADVEPLASGGTLMKAPKWLFDPLGPLSMPIGYAPQMVPWMLRFAYASLPGPHAASTRAQVALMALARSETEALLGDAGIGHMVRRDGALYLYEGAAALKAAHPLWKERQRHGVSFEAVHGERLAELQPGLGASYTHGMYVTDWWTVSDPHDYARALADAALAGGARFEIGNVAGIAPGPRSVVLTLDDGRSLEAGQVIVAGGAWSHRLTALLGDRIPLETERGYNTTLPPGAFDLRRQLVLPADGYVITPLATGIRVGGAVELAGLDRPPNYRRSEAMLRKSEKVLPGIKTGGGTQWMGFRPSLPDTLPVIGRSPGNPNVLYAFGHGHLGLTQSAATARLVADLALGREPAIDLRPYRPERF